MIVLIELQMTKSRMSLHRTKNSLEDQRNLINHSIHVRSQVIFIPSTCIRGRDIVIAPLVRVCVCVSVCLSVCLHLIAS